MKCYCHRKTEKNAWLCFPLFLKDSEFRVSLFSFQSSRFSIAFAHQFTTIHQALWGPESASSMIYRVHAAVSIRRIYVTKTLIASTNSSHGPKNTVTEQTARKFAGVKEPLQSTLGTLGVRPPPTPTPWVFLFPWNLNLSRQYELKQCECNGYCPASATTVETCFWSSLCYFSPLVLLPLR